MGKHIFNSKNLYSLILLFSLFSAFAITNFVGCGGGTESDINGTSSDASGDSGDSGEEPNQQVSGDISNRIAIMTFDDVLDPEGNPLIIGFVDKGTDDFLGLTGERDSEGNITKFTGAVLSITNVATFVLEIDDNGLPTTLTDVTNGIIIEFSRFTSNTVDLTFFKLDDPGGDALETITIPFDQSQITDSFNANILNNQQSFFINTNDIPSIGERLKMN